MAEPFLGEIMMFCGNYAPAGWMMCNGQGLPVAQYSALYAILGNTYGGDQNNFNLPDMRGRVPIHPGQGPNLSLYALGSHAGAEQVTLSPNQMPLHTHMLAADGNGSGKTTPIGNFPGAVAGSAAVKPYSSGPASGNMAATAISPAGGSTPVSLVQPYLCVNFVIAITGIFPTRE